MKKILLVGQPVDKNKRGNVGSGGGYVRNMRVYLKYFQSSEFKIIPLFHTSRKEYSTKIFSKILRLSIDFNRIIAAFIKHNPDGIHIMAQYRNAAPREFMYVLISKIFKKPFLYEIKAGAFIDAYLNRSNIYKKMIKYILTNSKIILVEGKVYSDFLSKQFQIGSHYFPNVVPDSEIPTLKKTILTQRTIRILFVGYCNYDKGVYQLVEACKMLSDNSIPIELNLIGEEEYQFTIFADGENIRNSNFKMNRYGGQSHDFILSKMQKCDVFCYPTFHSGEGHSNSINESMMNTMIIVTTQKGFLGDILNDNSAYFIKEQDSQDIYNKLMEINTHRNIAITKAKNAYQLLIENYTVSKIASDIRDYYHQLVS